jgi:hypothetical protein
MKLTPDNNSEKGNKVILAEQRNHKTQRKTASMILKPGHRVFEFDLKTGLINEAKIEKTEAVLSVVEPLKKGKAKNIRKKILQRDQCLYTPALNKINALKRFVTLYDELIAAGVIVRPEKPNKTSLEAYLCLAGGRDPEEMAIKMFELLTSHPTENNPVWELLEATGDAEYEQSSFRKAAEIILAKN